MKVEVVGKNGFTPSEFNRDYIVKKLLKLEKDLPDFDEVQARVVCKVYNSFHKVEVTIPTKNIMLRAEVQDNDVYAAIDGAVDKLQTQIRRYNDRVKDKLGRKGIRSADIESSSKEKRVVKGKNIDLEPMTREEAIDQMELLDHDFFIYLDKETRKTNVIYLRNDGHYAVIETNTK